MGQIKRGVTVVFEGDPYLVVAAEFTRKQQRRPVMRTVLKNLKTGQTKEHSFMQADKIEEAEVERKSFNFLYKADQEYVFMDNGSFEQVEINEETVGDAAKYMLEGQNLELVFFNGECIQVELPIKVERRVLSAPPGIKGDTSTNVMKEVEVDGGAKIKAPLFIKEGDKVIIDTRSNTYVERA